MKYVLDAEHLHSTAKRAQTTVSPGASMDAMLDAVTDGLAAAYPGAINTDRREWIFSSAGGNLGQIALLHCSLNEYLLFFGTPLSTWAHSGRYRVDIWDAVLTGEMRTWGEGQHEATMHPAGTMNLLRKNQAHGYSCGEGTMLLEYGRGPIPTALPFGLADIVSSNLDFKAFGQTMRGYTKLTLRSFRQRLSGRKR